MDEHQLVVTVKQMALDLGQVPTRAEFCAQVIGGESKLIRFGGYTALLKAAGLDTYDDRRSGKKKPKQSPFIVSLESHLEAQVAAEEERREQPVFKRRTGPYPKVGIMGDYHLPFGKKIVEDKFITRIEKTKPDFVFQMGDLYDMYSHGRFPRSHNVFMPAEEERIARQQAEIFWARVRKACPQAKCIQIVGNHDIRPLKRLSESLPSMEHWGEKYLKELMTFDGVQTIHDAREEFFIEDIAFFHGYRSQLGSHRDHIMYNCVNGHSHRGGVSYRHLRGQTLFELNVGYGGDPESKGLSYTPQRIESWTHGFGEIDSEGPRFIPIF